MKFLIDAQLPRRLAYRFREAGYDCVHTLDLPAGNRTTDSDIIAIADLEERIVITKDADFANSFLLAHKPEKLLLVSTGNITNTELEALLYRFLPALERAFVTNAYIELNRTSLIIHS